MGSRCSEQDKAMNDWCHLWDRQNLCQERPQPRTETTSYAGAHYHKMMARSQEELPRLMSIWVFRKVRVTLQKHSPVDSERHKKTQGDVEQGLYASFPCPIKVDFWCSPDKVMARCGLFKTLISCSIRGHGILSNLSGCCSACRHIWQSVLPWNTPCICKAGEGEFGFLLGGPWSD